MSRLQELVRPSLLHHFDAPNEYRGTVGWLCGYSADATFLNDAAERFTRATAAQRSHDGRVSLALMLDAGNPQISMIDAPGVAHLAMLSVAEKSFRLLHAKVALLGFRHKDKPHRWLLRLVVSTGNWTTQTVEESLDLAWCIELRSEELETHDEDVSLRCADIDTAWSLLSHVADQCDTRVLALDVGGIAGETSIEIERAQGWIGRCRVRRGRAKPRFFDSREKSLLAQLPTMIKRSATGVRRNYLAMGSGFYETKTLPGKAPRVLANIRQVLEKAGLLIRTPEIDVFVSDTGCQSVAQFAAEQSADDSGFTVRPAGQPEALFGKATQRSLHAKFIFSANHRKGSNNCSSAWVYLGSGNLTGPGFTERMSRSGGNLEAGVVFASDDLCRRETKGTAPGRVVTNLLPIQWDHESQLDHLVAGADMPERNAEFVAPPVPYLSWRIELDEKGVLILPMQAPSVEVLDLQGEPCTKRLDAFLWPEHRPRQAVVRWFAEGMVRRAHVPVVDEFGRLAATPLPKLDLSEAWWQLANFPLPPDDEGPDFSLGDDGNGFSLVASGSQQTMETASQPIRIMMETIENIAARQTSVTEADWPSWCNRLQQVLAQASDSDVVRMFLILRLNPLSALHEIPFRPGFAETDQTESGVLYEHTLAAIEASWKITDLPPIGRSP